MESFELRVFREVAYTKSITKAATQMGYVQSNITAHIKNLETELGTKLFIRHSQGVTLTSDGEVLLDQAEKILSLLDTTSSLLKKTSKTWRIGTTQTIANYVLPEFLTEYQRRFPNMLISITTLQQDLFETQLKNNLLDCVITNQPSPLRHAQRIHQWKEDIRLIAPSTCQTLESIKDYPIITNNIKACPYRNTLLSWWNEQAYDIRQIIEFDTVEGILTMVASGNGVSLLPASTLRNRDDIQSFKIEELQVSFLYMWISMERDPSLSLELLEKFLK
ncbi:MAG: LysR family transcriptional regulator [Longicatena sp.]